MQMSERRAKWEAEDTPAEALTHEARRYCHGDADWTDWQPCTAEQAARYKKDDTFQVRLRSSPAFPMLRRFRVPQAG